MPDARSIENATATGALSITVLQSNTTSGITKSIRSLPNSKGGALEDCLLTIVKGELSIVEKYCVK